MAIERNTELSDKELIALLQTNVHLACKEIYAAYWPALVKYAFGFLKDEDQAKDVIQEVFLALLERETLTQIHSELSSYLYRSVRYHCIRLLNRRLTHGDLSQLFDSFMDATHPEHAAHALIVKELEKDLARVLVTLPEGLKKTFELSRNEGLSAKQISLQLGLSDQTVRNQISKVLQILKRNLSVYRSFFLL